MSEDIEAGKSGVVCTRNSEPFTLNRGWASHTDNTHSGGKYIQKEPIVVNRGYPQGSRRQNKHCFAVPLESEVRLTVLCEGAGELFPLGSSPLLFYSLSLWSWLHVIASFFTSAAKPHISLIYAISG